MWFTILPTILFLASILGMIILVLRRVPEVVELDKKELETESTEMLSQKGVPVMVFSRVRVFVIFWLKRIWQFLLEVKDMGHTPAINYKIKKILKEPIRFKTKKQNIAPNSQPLEEQLSLESHDEVYYLERIKAEPKNLHRYSALGNFYLHTKNYDDAQGVYEYLVKYDPGNSGYYAKLAFVRLARGQYLEAISDYQKSVALDPGFPSRYYNLGLAYKALGKWSESVESFSKACEIEPDNVKYKSMKEYAISQIGN